VLLDSGFTLAEEPSTFMLEEEEAITTLLLESSFLTEELLLSPPTELEEFLAVVEELDYFTFFSLEEDFSLPELF